MSLPLKLTKGEPMEVELDAIEPMPAEADAILALENLGMSKIPQGTLRDMRTIGVYVKGAGVIKIQHGRAMVTQQMLAETMRKVMKLIEEAEGSKLKTRVKTVMTGAKVIADLAKVQTENQKVSVLIESLTPAGSRMEAEIFAPSFRPGQEVRASQQTMVVAQEAHFHGNGSPPSEK